MPNDLGSIDGLLILSTHGVFEEAIQEILCYYHQ